MADERGIKEVYCPGARGCGMGPGRAKKDFFNLADI